MNWQSSFPNCMTGWTRRAMCMNEKGCTRPCMMLSLSWRTSTRMSSGNFISTIKRRQRSVRHWAYGFVHWIKEEEWPFSNCAASWNQCLIDSPRPIRWKTCHNGHRSERKPRLLCRNKGWHTLIPLYRTGRRLSFLLSFIVSDAEKDKDISRE